MNYTAKQIKRDGEKLERLILDSDYDQKHKLNTYNKPVPRELLDEIDSEGITSERLSSMEFPVYKYMTQITIHGLFPKYTGNGRIGFRGYKNIFQNKNKSIGIKYHAIDHNKKDTIYSLLKQSAGYSSHKDSTNWYAYKMKVSHNKETILKHYQEFKKESERLNAETKGLFYGSISASLYYLPLLGYLAEIVIYVSAIFEPNIKPFVEAISGKSYDAILKELRDAEAKAEKESQERAKRYEKERQEKQRKREDLIKVLESKLNTPYKRYPISSVEEGSEFIVFGYWDDKLEKIRFYKESPRQKKFRYKRITEDVNKLDELLANENFSYGSMYRPSYVKGFKLK